MHSGSFMKLEVCWYQWLLSPDWPHTKGLPPNWTNLFGDQWSLTTLLDGKKTTSHLSRSEFLDVQPMPVDRHRANPLRYLGTHHFLFGVATTTWQLARQDKQGHFGSAQLDQFNDTPKMDQTQSNGLDTTTTPQKWTWYNYDTPEQVDPALVGKYYTHVLKQLLVLLVFCKVPNGCLALYNNL